VVQRRVPDQIPSLSYKLKSDLLVHEVLPALPAPLVHRVSKAFEENRASLAPWVLLALLGLEVYLDFLAKMVKPEKMVKLDLLERLVRLVLAVFPACLVFPALKDTEDSRVWTVVKENLDRVEKKERKA